MPDHVSQVSVVARCVWQEDGLSAMREVSSAYCSRLDLSEETPMEYPNSAWDLLMVSTRVFITMLNTSTDRGSPWYTPICRWKGSVCQDSVEMIPMRSCMVQAGRHVYHFLGSVIMLQGEMDKIMVDTAKSASICQGKPADTEGLVLSAGFIEDGQELQVVFCASWYTPSTNALCTAVLR